MQRRQNCLASWELQCRNKSPTGDMKLRRSKAQGQIQRVFDSAEEMG